MGIEQIEERFGASGYKSFRQAGRLDQNVNVLNQIVGRIRCPSVCPSALSRVEVGVAKLKGKSKERMEWKPQAEIKGDVFLIGRIGTATLFKTTQQHNL